MNLPQRDSGPAPSGEPQPAPIEDPYRWEEPPSSRRVFHANRHILSAIVVLIVIGILLAILVRFIAR